MGYMTCHVGQACERHVDSTAPPSFLQDMERLARLWYESSNSLFMQLLFVYSPKQCCRVDSSNMGELCFIFPKRSFAQPRHLLSRVPIEESCSCYHWLSSGQRACVCMCHIYIYAHKQGEQKKENKKNKGPPAHGKILNFGARANHLLALVGGVKHLQVCASYCIRSVLLFFFFQKHTHTPCVCSRKK